MSDGIIGGCLGGIQEPLHCLTQHSITVLERYLESMQRVGVCQS